MVARMSKDRASVPPGHEKDETRTVTPEVVDAEQPVGASDMGRKPKPFVRVARRSQSNTARAESSAKDAKQAKIEHGATRTNRTTIVEAEVVDDDRDESEDAEDGDDRAFARVVEGEVEFDDRLPAVAGSLGDAPFAEVEVEVEGDEETEPVEDTGLVVAGSPLQRYLAELRKYPLMTIEEERETARRAHEQGDVAARNRLVTANLRLVVKIAMEYRRAYSQILDLIQEGNAGLVQAVNRFNPYMNVKLSTYGAWWIRAYILKFLMDNKSLVRMGTTDAQRKLFFRLRGEAERMYALTQRFDARLLAENIGVKESDVVEMQQRLTKNDVSLDAPVREDADTRHIDTLVSETSDPDVAYERKELLEILRAKVGEIEKELGERDAYIFRYRILAEEPVTLQDVGDKFGITRERARQLEARVLKRVKEALLEAGVGE
jgi:RNA polymerase sigma-32 factor